MARTLYVKCSHCEAMMEIDSETGDILKKWAPKDKSKGGDTMEDALRNLKEGKKWRENLLKRTKDEIEGQKKKIEDAFRKEVDRVKREGIKDAPQNPFDRD